MYGDAGGSKVSSKFNQIHDSDTYIYTYVYVYMYKSLELFISKQLQLL